MANKNRPYRQVLAITFTNKAALEMKERVLESLIYISSGTEIDTSKYLLKSLVDDLPISEGQIRTACSKLLSEILHDYSRFSMQTIDSFTQRVVHSFAQDLKLPLNFETELDAKLLLDQAASRLLENQSEDQKLNTLLKKLAAYKFEDGRSLNLLDELVDLGGDLLLEQQHDLIKSLKKWDLDQAEKDLKEAKQKQQKFLAGVHAIGESLKRIFSANHLGPSDIKHKEQGGVYGYFMGLTEVFKAEQIMPKKRAEKAIVDGEIFSTDGKKQHPSSLEELLHLELRKLLEFIELVPEIAICEAVISQYYRMMLISYMANSLTEVYAESRLLHISEFNKIIASQLQDQPAAFIYERIGERYRHYFLDEFQDTSELQWSNLSPLVENALASDGSSLLVGDAKQGIYRWRAGSSEQFVAIASANQYQMNDRAHEVIRLDQQEGFTNTNYRSSKTVVDFNNALFLACADGFDREEYQNLYKEAFQEAIKPDNGYVEVSCIERPSKTNLDHLDWLGSSVKKTLEAGYQPKHIAVLVRTKNQGQLYANYLIDNGYKVISADTVRMLQNAKIQMILHCLEWVEQPADAVKSLAVYQDLIDQGIEIKADHQYQNKADALVLEVPKLLPLDTWRKMSLLPLVEAICNKLKINTTKDPYVLGFLDLAYKFSSQMKDEISSFIEYLEQKNPAVELPEDPDAIQIVTIHSSKGLEYPVVILPVLGEKKVKPGSKFWVNSPDWVSAGKLKLSVTQQEIYDQDIQDQLIQKTNEEELDSLNLLYVACTRAKQALFIASCYDKKNRGLSVDDWINNHLDLQTGGVKSFGALQKVDFEAKSDEQNKLKGSEQRLAWDQRLKISKTYVKMFGPEQERFFGTLLHAVMEQIETKDDIGESLEKMRLEGTIKLTELEKVKPLVEAIVNHNELQHLFSGLGFVRREQSLLNGAGSVLRPDLVVEFEDQIEIVDYKTGKATEKNSKQIINYLESVRLISNKKVKAHLVYVSDQGILLEQYGA